MRTRVGLIALFLLAVAAPLVLADDPTVTRGVALDGLYQIHDIDIVNLFNGNLMVNVPLGAQFPLDGGMSYSIQLVYTGKPFDFVYEQRNTCPGDDTRHCTETHALPHLNPRSNAGLSWRVSMGRLTSFTGGGFGCAAGTWATCSPYYESSDGAMHRFYTTMHDVETPEPGVFYSRDGSYLRLRNYSSNYTEIEFPNGMVHRFDDSGRLTQIYTPFDRAAGRGPSVTVDYLAGTQCPNGDSCWKVHDVFDRTHWVTFATTGHPNSGSTAAQQIILAAPNNTTATYSLKYNNTAGPYSPASDPFLLWDDINCYDRWNFSNDPTGAYTPILTSIVLPDGSQYQLTTQNASPADPNKCYQGSLTSLTLPTMGRIDYDYQDYMQLRNHPHVGQYDPPYGVGVKTRTKASPAGVRLWQWQYSAITNDIYVCSCIYGGESRELDVTVTEVEDPDGAGTVRSKMKHYFSTTRNSLGDGRLTVDHGLPFTRRVSDGNGRYLSTEIYNNGAVDRTTYVSYDVDWISNFEDNNRREAQSYTVFGSDANHWTSVVRSNFDGLGHYRNMVSDGNFAAVSGVASPDQRTDFVNYNPSHGIWYYAPVESQPPPNNSYVPWPSSSPWVLGTFDKDWKLTPPLTASDSPHVQKHEYCFAGDTGFLRRVRTLANDAATESAIARDGRDLITELATESTNASGNITAERYYGGSAALSLDGTAVPPDPSVGFDDLCALTLTSPRYELRHEYAFGVRKTSRDYSGGAAMTFYTLNRVVDKTGATTQESDPSDVVTSYTFDTVDPRRIKTVTTTGLSQVSYDYAPAQANPFVPAQVTVTQSDTTQRVQYDGFGRLWREFRMMPQGEVKRETLYDGDNRKTSQSVWSLSSSFSPLTSFSYDQLGRVVNTTLPDGSATTNSYTGDRVQTTTFNVFEGTDLSAALTPVTSAETRDRYGRLRRVDEPNGTVTTYGYDGMDHLASVCMNDSGGSCGQQRSFSYDHRGFLTAETHPENGTVQYTYDARGHMLTERLDPAGTAYDLDFTYDDAERLTQVAGRNPDYPGSGLAFRENKAFTYGADNAGTDLRKGKLLTAVRHNYQPRLGGDFIVTETNAYADPSGHLTDRTTEIKDPTGAVMQSFKQSQSYNVLGLPATTTYPYCQGTVHCGAPKWTAVTSSYSNGLLTSLANAAAPGSPFVSMTYHPSGMVNQVTHGNMMVDQYSADPSGMARPLAISFGSYAACARPTITTQPQSISVPSGQRTTLTVVANGSGTLGYQWYDVNAGALANEISYQFRTPPVTSAHTYYVKVFDSCGVIASDFVTVSVETCTPPSITAHPLGVPIALGNSAHLTVSASGSAPSYQWYQGASGVTTTPVGTNQNAFDTPPLSAPTQYWVRVSNSCGTADSNAATLTIIQPPASANATLAANGTSIVVSWSASASAHHYVVERRANGSGYTAVATVTPPSVSWSDSVNANSAITYVYRVRAADSFNQTTPPSPEDLATTINFTPISSTTAIAAQHLNELRTAMNAVRAANGWPALAWADILSPGVPAPESGKLIYGEHITKLRARLDEALAALVGWPAGNYTDPVLPGSPPVAVKTIHVTELRSRVQ